MDLPLELPKELRYLGEAKDSKMLMEMLTSLPPDLITFFESACEDSSWCAKHTDFMNSAIQWITIKSFEERLMDEFAQRAATAIRKNFNILRHQIFLNLIFEVDGKQIKQNSLLWATVSDYFHKHIRIECREKKNSKISMGAMNHGIFEQIQEYVETGNVNNLWRKSEREILEVFRDASEWNIPGLMIDCEILLKKYITPENAIETLISAHKNRWLHLKLTCMEFINHLNLGIYLEIENVQNLSVEVLNFRRKTLEVFEQLSSVITHLHLGGSLAENPEFSDVIQRCPNLIGINFSGSVDFSDKFLAIPQDIQDLDLSKCTWLKGEYLQMFARACPNIKTLNLTSNYDLTYDDWTELYEFYELETLDISRCHQIKNEDFTVIFKACRMIKKLIMVECIQVEEAMFNEIGRVMSGLTDLNIARCNISDAALVDLSTKCNNLVTLNLVRCLNITEKGITEAIRHFPSLRELDISNCRIPPVVLQKMKKIRPTLKITF